MHQAWPSRTAGKGAPGPAQSSCSLAGASATGPLAITRGHQSSTTLSSPHATRPVPAYYASTTLQQLRISHLRNLEHSCRPPQTNICFRQQPMSTKHLLSARSCSSHSPAHLALFPVSKHVLPSTLMRGPQQPSTPSFPIPAAQPRMAVSASCDEAVTTWLAVMCPNRGRCCHASSPDQVTRWPDLVQAPGACASMHATRAQPPPSRSLCLPLLCPPHGAYKKPYVERVIEVRARHHAPLTTLCAVDIFPPTHPSSKCAHGRMNPDARTT